MSDNLEEKITGTSFLSGVTGPAAQYEMQRVYGLLSPPQELPGALLPHQRPSIGLASQEGFLRADFERRERNDNGYAQCDALYWEKHDVHVGHDPTYRRSWYAGRPTMNPQD